MVEEEIVISSWEQPELMKDENGSLSRPVNRTSSKENIDMNAWLTEQDSKIMTSEVRDGDDMMLDEEKLSRLIEGDLKNDKEHFNKSRKPNPKPQHETGLPNKNSSDKNVFSVPNDSADNLFPGQKGSADNLLSSKKGSADYLFSGGKIKKESNDSMTSPRPVPRPRLKTYTKEKEQDKEEFKFLNETSDSIKLSAEKLFDSLGRSSKSVSFLDSYKDSETQKGPQRKESIEKSERRPPKISPRNRKNSGSSARKGKSSDESDSEQNSSNNKQRPQPKQRQHVEQRFSESSSPASGKNSQNSWEHNNRPQPKPRRHIEQDRKTSQGSDYHERRLAESSESRPLSGKPWTSDGIGSKRPENRSDIHERQHQRHYQGDVIWDSDTGISTKYNGYHMMSEKQLTPGWEEEHNNRNGEYFRGHDDLRRINEGFSRDDMSERWVTPGWVEHSNRNGHYRGDDGDPRQNTGGYPRDKHDMMSVGRVREGSSLREHVMYERDFRKGHDKKGNATDMFQAHVPASNEIVLNEDKEERNHNGRKLSDRENKTQSPMKAHRGLNEMTKSPDIYNFKYESRDSPQDDKFSQSKRSSSLTDLNSWKNIYDEEISGSPRSEFSSSRGIRDAVYAEWLEKKQGKLKEAARKKMEEKRKEEEKIKEKQEKEIMAKKAFEAWSSKKEEVIRTEIKKKKEVKEKEVDEKREKILKKQDAKKFFESWKSKKDEVLKESYKEKKEKERAVKQMKIEDHKEKIEIAKKSYDKWKLQKDELLKKEARSARQAEKLKTKYEKEAEMEKRQECEKTFQEFLRKKGTGKRAPPSPTLTQRAWCPGGLTKGSNLIPEKVQPVIAPPKLNRSRSFSGTTRAMMSFNTTKRLSRGW